MLKVLVNAYACSPNMGSEPGMGWNWCVNLAKYCELYIITEGEFRKNIERAIPQIEQGKNMHFYYNPVPEKVRRMCWNQGDWRFYWYYRKWQKKTLAIAESICKNESIDIIHQLNMIGFRESGLLWKIKGPKYVWGPIGGLISIPSSYLWAISKKEVLKNILKRYISALQIRYSYSVQQAIKRADLLLGATMSETDVICSLYKKQVIQENETGLNRNLSCKRAICYSPKNSDFNLIWVGRFIPTKQLMLALETMKLLKGYSDIKLHVVGTGDDVRSYKTMAQKLGVENNCIWYGQIDNIEVQRLMCVSDLLFFTSIAEATSTVILESISNKLPILCFDTCGFGPLVDERIGVKIQLKRPKKSAEEFASVIKMLYANRWLLMQMSANCESIMQHLTWESKAKKMYDYYCGIYSGKC